MIGECDVLIAVIGAHWLTSTDEQDGRRLDNPEDFVRREIATALKRDIRVIPVLVDGALMPRSTELPDDLKPLVRRNALQVTDTGFDDDCRRLVAAIEQVLEKATAERAEREEKKRLGTEGRGTEAKELLEAERGHKEEQVRLEHKTHPLPPGLVAPSTPSAKKLRPVIGIMTLLAFGIGLAVVAAIYFGSQRLTSEPMAQPSVSTSTPVAVVTPIPTTVATPSAAEPATPTAIEEQARRFLEKAAKEQPWQNSLGMKFVLVAGTQVLFSIWDTRVQDFSAFIDSTGYNATGGMWSLGWDGWKQRGATWKEPGFFQGSTHPVVGVSYDDAKAFCEWLTKQERGSGALPEGMRYRLPTDQEWSVAVGLDSEAGNTPQEKASTKNLYPWGTRWPPPPGAGNYCGMESRTGNEPRDWVVLEGYNDGYARTSPVGSFAANKNALYDMGGNVWQLCEDLSGSENKFPVERGASWVNPYPGVLLLSFRLNEITRDARWAGVGFRCVVARESSR
jgi:formylglycine-generating enzyme required for sulfatase activity